MNSEDKISAEKAEKKKKRLRFAGLVALTVLVVVAVIVAALIAKSCTEKVSLDIGQPYDAGKATVTVTDVTVKRIATTEQVYAIVTLKVEADKDFVLDPYDFELDGVSPMRLTDADDNVISTAETKVAAGQTAEVSIAFLVPRSMKVSILSYKKAEIRLGSMIENDNNLSKE